MSEKKKKVMLWSFAGVIVASFLYWTGVYLSGWEPKRGDAAVFIYSWYLMAILFGGLIGWAIVETSNER